MATPRVVVLLEGQSDVAAMRALLPEAPTAVELVDMGGVTNIRRHLTDLLDPAAGEGAGRVHRILGLCDAREAPFFARALESIGHPVSSPEDMAELGFQVCDEDLEDELIRALGTDRVVAVLDGLGLVDRFATFRKQPSWAGRPVADQLRRFAGTTSGRKELVAEALAAAALPDRVPPPLAALVTQIEAALTDPRVGPPVCPFNDAG